MLRWKCWLINLSTTTRDLAFMMWNLSNISPGQKQCTDGLKNQLQAFCSDNIRSVWLTGWSAVKNEVISYKIKIYRVSHELRSLLRESVPYVKIYRYNPIHLCPKLNSYGDNGQRKVLTSCISAYCTSSALSALTLTEQCSRHLCECTSSAQRDKIVLHYCQIFMRYVQCLVTLRTTMTWVRVVL